MKSHFRFILEVLLMSGTLIVLSSWCRGQPAESAEQAGNSPEETSYEPDGEIELSQFRPPRGPGRRIEPVIPLPPTIELRSLPVGPAVDTLDGLGPLNPTASDAGSLFRGAAGIATPRRGPGVNDVRPRANHFAQILPRGSFWVPARLDLDTALSKLDSGAVSEILVIKGPYSSLYGPGFSFIDVDLFGARRYSDGLEWHGSTSLNFQTNGQQWYGRQTILGGSSDWGFRASYGHRTGNDYETGDGSDIPSSYKSRDFETALGMDLSPDSHIEFSYLRLDQTDVEFPGQIFDMDFLVTDGYELKYVLENQCYFDRLTFDTWYNRTRFEGNAQRSGKRRQIPQLNPPPSGVLDFVGFTDVDSMSTGYRAAVTWGEPGWAELTFGTDLRYIEQQLNEFDAFSTPPLFVRTVGNFPIPRSHSSNPGLFLEAVLPFSESLKVKGGARADWVSTDIEGTTEGRTNADMRTLLGTDSFDQDFNLWSAYITGEYQVDCHWTALAGFGTGQRPPTLTELYAVDPFLAILQQGFTQVRGNPDLHAERLWQIDLGFKTNYGRFRGGINGFYAWVHDYITYEVIDRTLVDGGLPGGLGVRFVNTELATLSGGEMHGEYDWNSCLTPFASLSFVEGRDHSRGNRGLIRGSDEEPLPGIAPLESRLGVRYHQAAENPRWGIELAARLVDNQDRVASSLLERESAGFTTYDLRGYWRATDRLLLVSGVDNFTDKQYREHLDLRTGNGVFQPGVNFYFGFELQY